MTEATESDDKASPQDAADSDASAKTKRSKSAFDASEMIEALEGMEAPIEVISAFKRVVKEVDKMQRKDVARSESLKKERALRQNAEMELQGLRVKVNLLELEIQDYEQEKVIEEDKKYEDIEEAGGW